MLSFEMYQLSAWSEQGLTLHVANVFQSIEATLKRTLKNTLITSSKIATAISNKITNEVSFAAASRVLVRPKSHTSKDSIAHGLVPIGYWPELINDMSKWKSVKESSSQFEPEPLF